MASTMRRKADAEILPGPIEARTINHIARFPPKLSMGGSLNRFMHLTVFPTGEILIGSAVPTNKNKQTHKGKPAVKNVTQDIGEEPIISSCRNRIIGLFQQQK